MRVHAQFRARNERFEQVYEMGRYFWGVGKSAQKYPRGYQIVDFGGANELSVFDKKGLEVILGSSFQYRFVRGEAEPCVNPIASPS